MDNRIRLPCLLGCQDGVDSMNHYVHCPFWLYLLVKALPVPPSSLPLTRLGLVDPGIHTLRAVSASFAGYHAVKRLAKQAGFGENPLDEHQVHMVHACFLDAFCGETHDMGLRCNSFSRMFEQL